MLIARLHLDDGSEVERPILDGETVPYRIHHIEDQEDKSIIRTFAYRNGQSGGETIIHYDEMADKTEFVTRQSA